MDLKPFIKPLGFVSTCLAIVQGLVWTILSILTILIHFEAWIVESSKTHEGFLGDVILNGYIVGEEGFSKIAEVIVIPKYFYIWAILFLIISLFWISLSVYFIIVLIKNQNHNYKKCMLTWGMWTIVVCIVDLLLTCLLAKDYSALVASYNKSLISPNFNVNVTSLYVILACGVMMSISARGYVVWILNIALAIIMLTIYFRLPKKFELLQSEYSTNSLTYLRNPKEQGRRVRHDSESSFGTFQGLPRIPPTQSTNEGVTGTNQRDLRYPSFSYQHRQEKHPDYFVKSSLPFRKQ